MDLIYTQTQIDKLDANSGDLIEKRESVGFVNTDCNIVKNILLGIMRLTVQESIIFNDDKKLKLNKLYNTAVYGG